MGVRGLCKFIDENPHLYKSYHLHDTKVIMDGCNLIHFLYMDIGIDCTFGGEYGEYADKIKEYFACYKECNIEPIVILDGGSEISDLKFPTRLKRLEDRLKKVKDTIESNSYQDPTFLPINAFDVFKNVLCEIGVRYLQCDYEGDNQMAALANDYNCPVLSNDSDFYIFNLRRGFIRFSYIDTQVKIKRSKYGADIKYMKCSIYFTNTFLKYYPLKDTSNLSLFATLVGNDYITYEDTKQFFFKIKIHPKEKLSGLLLWLRNLTLDQALKQVLRLTHEDKRDDIEDLIQTSLEEYVLKPTTLREVLDANILNPRDRLIKNTQISTLCGTILPAQFVIAFHKGYISTPLLNVVTLHQIMLQPQVEEFSDISSYACSRYVRQVTYGILLRHSTRNINRHARKCIKKINEYDRVNDTIVKFRVPFLTELKNGTPVPKLTEISDQKKPMFRTFMAKLLEVDEMFFLGVQNNLQLLFGCIVYWLYNCSTKPTKEFLNALVLCIVYYQMKETSVQGHTGRDFKNKLGSKNSSLGVRNNNVCRCLGKYLQKPVLNVYDSLVIKVIQSYSQLQVCIKDIMELNSLFEFPFDSPQLHEALSGIMLYNLTIELTSKQNVNEFAKKLLGNDDALIFQFDMIRNKILGSLPKNYFVKKPNKNNSRNKFVRK